MPSLRGDAIGEKEVAITRRTQGPLLILKGFGFPISDMQTYAILTHTHVHAK